MTSAVVATDPPPLARHAVGAARYDAPTMSDQKLRDIERRWKETGSPDDEAAESVHQELSSH